MDYKDKYNKLVNAIKVLQEANPSDEGIQNWVNDNVPELKESEGERVRKEILEYFQQFENEELRGVNISDWLAWLEKQKQKVNVTKFKPGDKKVSSIWSVEDEFKVQRICKYLEEAKKYYGDITEIRDCIDWLKFIQNKISIQNIKSPLWKKVDQPIYINTKDIALVQKKDQSDLFKGCLLYLDHTLDPKVDERYILLNDLL